MCFDGLVFSLGQDQAGTIQQNRYQTHCHSLVLSWHDRGDVVLKKKKKKDFTSFCQPTRLITCAKEWQERQMHLFAHEVKAVHNESARPACDPAEQRTPSCYQCHHEQSSTLKYQVSLIPKSTSITACAHSVSSHRQIAWHTSIIQKSLANVSVRFVDANAYMILKGMLVANV